MKQAFDLFLSAFDGTKTIMAIYDYLAHEVHAPMDYSDLLRWQWIQTVSALDKFIHDIIRSGMLQMYTGHRNSTNKYLTFTIDLKTHLQIIQDPSSALDIFERQVLLKNGYQAFQDSEKISDALSYIWDEKNKWKVISNNIGMSEIDVKTQLRNISIRRNQMVHESDYPGNLMQRQTIAKDDVIAVVDFIKKIGIVFTKISRIPPMPKPKKPIIDVSRLSQIDAPRQIRASHYSSGWTCQVRHRARCGNALCL